MQHGDDVEDGTIRPKVCCESPKQRPTMNQVLLELEEALHSVDNFISRQPSSGASYQSTDLYRSMDNDHSQSFVSIDGVGFQRFHVDMDSFSMQSTSLRRLEENSRH